ncbi:RDD family protein [Stagnihabitans tardus]|uniref:RDD family protein n=1 Tax=Stagnihabitans tardus TaxID=2699202 RepID=A0AAE5BVP7_9RHOB|nr:RDD family protein [Stagnihabitans tardus]NBZ87453.1 RDD family protein [Stagnihabitans tardus]
MSYSGTITAEYGGFWRRVGAALIDGVILNIIQKVVEMVLGAIIPIERFMTVPNIAPGTSQDEVMLQVLIENWPLLLGYTLLAMIAPILYDVLLTASSWQATVGKRALGLIVVDLNGQRLTPWRATGRYFAKIPSALILGIGFLMVGWTERKQGLHDMIAGTLVVKKDSVAQSNVF